MATPSLRSRLGFRFMALAMTFSRKGPALEARVRSSGVREGMTVLDYACGPGYYTAIAARLVGPAGRVVAIDIQPDAVAMTEARARAAGVHNVGTVVSGRDTGRGSGSVDLVLLYDAIAGVDDRRGVLAELDRVLRPGGTLSVWVEHGAPEATLPLITGNSGFVLSEQRADILNFSRG